MAFQLKALSEHTGSEVVGLDLRRPIAAEDADAIRAAYRQSHLLLIRQPDISDEDQLRLTQLFGNVMSRSNIEGMGRPVQYVSNSRPDGILPTGELAFHHDHINYEQPTQTGLLYGIEVPRSGSTTLFRNMSARVRQLSSALRARLAPVRCLHTVVSRTTVYNGARLTAGSAEDKNAVKAPQCWKPLIGVDAQCGSEVLWLSQSDNILEFDGIPEAEGRALVDDLWSGADDSIVYAHTWQPGDLVIWNNVTLAHARRPFQSHEPRTLRRTSAI